MDLGHWVNDGLMALFFFVDRARGAARAVGRASSPTAAASSSPRSPRVGGHASCPRCSTSPLNPAGEAASGWGVVIGTDTAFLLGALALVGPRCPTQLRVFLLTLTVVDDIVAVSVIGVVYSESLDPSRSCSPRVACSALVRCSAGCGVWRGAPYVVVGARAVAGDARVGPAPDDRRHGGRPADRRPRRRERDDGRARRVAGSGPSASRRCPTSAARPSASSQRAVSVNERLQTRAAPVDELRRSCRCSRSPTPASTCAAACSATRSRSPVTWGVVARPGRRQARSASASARCSRVRLGLGALPQGVGRGQVARRRGAVGHRLHRLAADRRPGLRHADAAATRRRSACCSPRVARDARSAGSSSGSPRSCAASATAEPADGARPARRPGARPHPRAGRRAADAGRVRRLRVPVLRPRHRRRARAARALRRRAALRLPPPAADRRPPARRARRRGRGGRRRAGALLGDARPALRPPGRARARGPARLRGRARPRRRAVRCATSRTSATPRGCARTSASAEASGARGTPTFFIGERRHVGPYDAETLAGELRPGGGRRYKLAATPRGRARGRARSRAASRPARPRIQRRSSTSWLGSARRRRARSSPTSGRSSGGPCGRCSPARRAPRRACSAARSPRGPRAARRLVRLARGQLALGQRPVLVVGPVDDADLAFAQDDATGSLDAGRHVRPRVLTEGDEVHPGGRWERRRTAARICGLQGG